jgi:Gas vesicle synthesis protein GvpL/GvpF
VIYVYGVTTSRDGLPEVAGLEDAPVEVRDVAGLAVAMSRLEAAPTLSDGAMLRHAEVVDALARSATVLPARFGFAFADEEALERIVLERRQELGAALERVRGCVELGLRVLAPEPERASTEPESGGDYLRTRLRETEERERLASGLHEALAERARDAHRSPSQGGWVLSAAYLVPAGNLDDFRGAVQTLESTHPELELVCTGPWPPYSFAQPATEAS